MTEPRNLVWPAFASILLAFALTVVPLPEPMLAFRPDWVLLTLVYWHLQLPRRIGVGTAWLCGLLLDALTGTLLGQHAFATALAGYLALKFHLRMRVFPIWQQTAAVFMILLVYHFLLFWVDGATGHLASAMQRWKPLIASTLTWPVAQGALHALRLRAGRKGA